MTVADQPSPRAARLPVPVKRASILPPPQFPLPPLAAHSWLNLFATAAPRRIGESDQKPLADVVDLLIMETLDHPAGAPPSSSPPPPPPSLAASPSASGAAVADPLDSLVQDHLKRSTQRMDGAAKPLVARAVDNSRPPAVVDEDISAADLLQREIEALLAGEPSPAAPIEPAAQAEPSETTNLDPTALNEAELQVLLKTPAPIASVPAAQQPAPPLHMPEEDEAASKMLEAEGILAEELAQLMAETTAVAEKPTPAADALAPSPSLLESTAALGTPEQPQPPEGVPEYPIVELAGEIDGDFESEAAPTRGHRWAGLMNDIALVTAQITDMPFRWIDLMDKNLLGVAAAVLLLSGIALKVAAWWMGV